MEGITWCAAKPLSWVAQMYVRGNVEEALLELSSPRAQLFQQLIVPRRFRLAGMQVAFEDSGGAKS